MDQQQLKIQLQKILNFADIDNKSLDDFYDEHRSLWQSLALSPKQVELWRMLVGQSDRTQQNDKPKIEQHILLLLQPATGGRMPLAQMLQRLPSDVRMTEQQLKKMIQLMTELEMKGPFVVLKG